MKRKLFLLTATLIMATAVFAACGRDTDKKTEKTEDKTVTVTEEPTESSEPTPEPTKEAKEETSVTPETTEKPSEPVTEPSVPDEKDSDKAFGELPWNVGSDYIQAGHIEYEGKKYDMSVNTYEDKNGKTYTWKEFTEDISVAVDFTDESMKNAILDLMVAGQKSAHDQDMSLRLIENLQRAGVGDDKFEKFMTNEAFEDRIKQLKTE